MTINDWYRTHEQVGTVLQYIVLSQWALQPQIEVNIWSISWHDTNRPDFDVMLMSNCKYYMDINIWGQYDVKNVSRKWTLTKKYEQHFDWKTFWFRKIVLMSMCNINWIPTVDVNWMSNSWHHENFHCWPMVDGQLTSTVDSYWCQFNIIFVTRWT